MVFNVLCGLSFLLDVCYEALSSYIIDGSQGHVFRS